MAEFNGLYQRVVYYDIVFRRDVTREVDFLMDVYKAQVKHDPRSMIDLACGPGYHARMFAGRGVRAIGLDLREEMIAFASDLAAADGVEVEWIAQDMRCLQLDEPVDIALNVFDGIDCLTSNTDLVAHLNAIADNLTPDGLYFIDVTNPRYTSFNCYAPFCYAGERDGVRVEINWAVNNAYVDPLTSIAHTEIEMRVQNGGDEIVTRDMAQERVLSAQEITLLAELSGKLRPVAWYGDFDMNVPYGGNKDTPRMIAVLQKTS